MSVQLWHLFALLIPYQKQQEPQITEPEDCQLPTVKSPAGDASDVPEPDRTRQVARDVPTIGDGLI